MNTDPLRPVAFVQPDHLNVLAHPGRHLVRMSAKPDAVCMMPLYTAQALWALRQQLLTEIRAVIPANMASDHPYRPVNLGWSQCAEIMRQYIDARLQEGERMPEEQIMTNIAVTPNEVYAALTFIRTNLYAALQEFAGLPGDHVGVRLTNEAYERARDVVREIAVHGIDAGEVGDE